MNEKFKDYLLKQEKEKSLRKLKVMDKEKYIDLSSNDYLSLSDHPYLKEKSVEYIKQYGTSGYASRLLSGNFEYHVRLEEQTARLKGKEACLIFGNGYIANSTVIPSLSGRDDVIFIDKFVHASIIDGVVLSRSKFFRFDHNDSGHLEKLLKQNRKKYRDAFIISESIFSMDGDRAPLKELVQLKEKYDTLLYIDEAHATGIFGPNGSGLLEKEGLSDRCDIIMGTYGKALGSYGAYIAASETIKQYLINKARGFIYSTALPASVAGASIAAIELLNKEPFRREQLLKNSEILRNKLINSGYRVPGDAQILPIIIGDNKKTVMIAEELKEKGFFVLPIRPPTVPEGTSRLRLSVTYSHTLEMLEKFYSIFTDILDHEK